MLPSTAAVIQRLSAAGTGDPEEASGLFIRMCYFSATTVTTLGFGDITPVSTEARVLSAAEAVVGVAIIGLFPQRRGPEIEEELGLGSTCGF